jgi:hypothetical protein
LTNGHSIPDAVSKAVNTTTSSLSRADVIMRNNAKNSSSSYNKVNAADDELNQNSLFMVERTGDCMESKTLPKLAK